MPVRPLSFFLVSLVALVFSPHRALAAAISPTVEVVNFGAKADDLEDDTEAINKAITAVAALGGGIVQLPAGRLIVNSQEKSTPVRLASGVTVKGKVGTSGNRLSTLFMPRGRSNRAAVVIGDSAYADEATDRVVLPTAIQKNVAIEDVVFDLDNDQGRRAVQVRFRTLGVRLSRCSGIQSGLDRGERPNTENSGDNHFLNLASYGRPALGEVTEDVLIEDCDVRGNLQLTSDGGSGVRRLTIQGNTVRGAYSHGIALTTVSDEALFEDILIENNQVLEIAGDALYLGHDEGINRTVHLVEGAVHRMQGVTVRGNVFSLSETSGPYANGIRLGSFLEFSEVRFENNTVAGWDGGSSTSRIAFAVFPWDLNWQTRGLNAALVGTSFIEGRRLSVPAHSFVSGMQVELRPKTAGDKLPTGLDPFRRYYVQRLSGDQIALSLQREGTPVLFGTADAASRFDLIFSPAIEDLLLINNRISGVWDYGIRLEGAVRPTVEANILSGTNVIGGSIEGLHWLDNSLARPFFTSTEGCSLLPAIESDSPFPSRTSGISGNTWSVDEAAMGPVFGISGVVDLDPHDARRSMAYEFTSNTIQFVPSEVKRFSYSLVDSTPTGSMEAVYADNILGRPSSLGGATVVAALSPAVVLSSSSDTPAGNTSGTPDEQDPKVSTPAAPVVPTLPPPVKSKLVNLSVRGDVGTSSPLIAGFTYSGTKERKFLIRAAGPALLPFGVSLSLANPTVTIHRMTDGAAVATNDDWSTNATGASEVRAAVAKVGAFTFASGSKDAAMVVSLPPGGYTAVVSGASGSSGVALVEVYDMDADDSSGELSNLSARMMGLAGDRTPIVGFVLSGETNRSLLIRGSGPSLKPFVSETTMTDPGLALYRAADTSPLLTNDNWGDKEGNQAAVKVATSATGAFSFSDGSRDAALVSPLAAGGYTALVSDKGSSVGLTLVEVYTLP